MMFLERRPHSSSAEDDPIILKYLTIIDPATGWFEIVKYNDK